MKKLFILTGALLVAALSVAIFVHKPMTAQEALILRNVEALADPETWWEKTDLFASLEVIQVYDYNVSLYLGYKGIQIEIGDYKSGYLGCLKYTL